jgi:isoamylase
MLLGGDELGRTQCGNNNAYCQDNELSWYDWERCDKELLAFTRQLLALRRAHPVFRRRGWFQGRPIRKVKGTALPDIGWFTPSGTEMTDEEWTSELSRSLQVFLNGHGILVPDERGEIIIDETFLIIFHAAPDELVFTLPEATWGARWRRVMDTERGFAGDEPDSYAAGSTLRVLGRSTWLLQREP